MNKVIAYPHKLIYKLRTWEFHMGSHGLSEYNEKVHPNKEQLPPSAAGWHVYQPLQSKMVLLLLMWVVVMRRLGARGLFTSTGSSSTLGAALNRHHCEDHLPILCTTHSCWHSGHLLFCTTHRDIQQLWNEWLHSPQTTREGIRIHVKQSGILIPGQMDSHVDETKSTQVCKTRTCLQTSKTNLQVCSQVQASCKKS